MQRPRSPIGWPGGKFYLAKKIIPFFPEHARYIEPFGGAMHVLFRKTPSAFEVYNDLDGRLVNFFQVVRDQPEKLFKRLSFALYSREWFQQARESMESGADVERAANFYMVNRMCFASKMGEWNIAARGTKSFFGFRERLMEAMNG